MQSTQVMTPSTDQDSTVSNDSRLVWESPKLEKLHVSLDTAFFVGSNSDGATGNQPSTP